MQEYRVIYRKRCCDCICSWFQYCYKRIKPESDLDVLIAPKGPGGLVRRQIEGRGVLCLAGYESDDSGEALDLLSLCAWYLWSRGRSN